MAFKSSISATLMVLAIGIGSQALACSTAAWNPGAVGLVDANDPANGVPRIGGDCGLRVSGTGHVQDNSPLSEGELGVRFYFYPQMSGTGTAEIFVAYSDEIPSSKLFSIRFDGDNIWVDASDASGGTSSPVAIAPQQWQLVEVAWTSGASGSLWVNANATEESPSATFDAGSGLIESVQLGAPDGFGGLTGRMFFDDYESRRALLIGPVPNFDALVIDNRETDARYLIESFYLNVLARGPEAGAVDSWYNGYFQYAETFTIDVRFVPREMARVFFLSDEYAGRSRTDEEFIRDCYQVFLGRQPSEGELNGWLSGEWQRPQTMTLFSESEEFGDRMQALFPGLAGNPVRNFVTTMYIGMLDRLVDSGGLDYFTNLFNTAYANGGIEGARMEAVEFGQTVLDSEEYQSQGPSNGTHILRFYRAYLGRFPGLTEFDYWVGELDSGRLTTNQVIQLFADSAEFTDKLNTYFQ